MTKNKININTQVIHGGISEDKTTGAVSFPIHLATTFRQIELGKPTGGFEYGRSGNPTRQSVEKLIADLEEGEAGFAFASGLAALTTVLLLFKKGDRIIISKNVYGGTFRLLDKVFKNFGLDYEIVDTSDLKKFEEAVKKDKSIRGVIVESPANPTLTITDLKAVGDISKKYNLLYIVDNTFLSPYLQKPLTLGADIVVHSATKYLAGHSDVISGLVVVKDKELASRIGFLQNAAGAVLSPFDSWLLIRSIKTLHVRIDRHVENAQYIAEKLEKYDGVEKIFFPGLKSFEGYEIHKKQARGPGGMISFRLAKGYDVGVFFKSLVTVALAESLGGVKSLACYPATMTHASVPKELREEIGITDNLIRLSIGIEDKDDILDDIKNAINKAKK
jgi:cystathionine beta-lyase